MATAFPIRLRGAALYMAATVMAAAPPPSPEQIQLAIAASPAIERGHWGALFLSLGTGEVLYSRNADSLFTPASNAKLVSTAAVLSQLGQDYRFRTRLLAAGPLDASGALNGDLVLAGGGDPTLGGIPVPYDAKIRYGDPLAPLAEMVESAWKAGLRQVHGDIVGDDTRYPWIPFLEGWAQDDTLYGYGAPVSALTLHDNLFEIRLRPAPRGEAPQIDIDPPLPYFTFDNRARSVARNGGAKIYLDRRPGSRHIEIWGSVDRPRSFQIAVDDPAAYAAFALRHLLIRRGIAVRGEARARHRAAGRSLDTGPEASVIASRDSPPLLQVLEVVNKISHNLWAEIGLREAARIAGLDETNPTTVLEDYFSGAGVAGVEYSLKDASGLSRLSLMSPAALVRVLRHMAASPESRAWLAMMPIGGEDGTLETRFRKNGRGRIAAKTGSLSGTAALSGYADAGGGEAIVFSVMVNNVNAPGSEMRQFIDRLVELFLRDR